MFAVIVSEKGGGAERHEFQQSEVTIGRVQGNDIILGKGNVSKRHSRIVLKDGRFIVVDLKSTNGTYVNGRKVTSPLVVKTGDKIYIGDYTLAIEGQAGTQSSVPARAPQSEPASPAAFLEPAAPVEAPPASPLPPRAPALRESPPPEVPKGKTWEPPRRELGGEGSRSAPARGPIGDVGSRGGPVTKHTSGYDAMASQIGDRQLRALMARIEAEIDVNDVSLDAMRDEGRWTEAERAAERAGRQLVAEGIVDDGDLPGLVAAAVREAVGLGALERILADDRVREVLVSSPANVAVDFGQGLEHGHGSFSDGRTFMTVLRRLATRAGTYLDRSVPVHELVLPSGALAVVVLPPVAVSGPILEIRRAHPHPTLDELVVGHSLTSDGRNAILRALTARRSIAVVGPSGSGVTTLLSAIAGASAPEDRLVVVAGLPDLRIERPGVALLAAGVGGQSPSLREVIAQASRLRGDRLVVDGATSDELGFVLARFAARTGGDLVGVRARVDESALATLRRLLELGGTAPSEVDAWIADGVQLVVELESDHGLRRVKRVAELRVEPSGLQLVDA